MRLRKLTTEYFLAHAKQAFDRITLPRFATGSAAPAIARPRLIANSERIHVGKRVRIGANSVLVASTEFQSPVAQMTYTPSITIGDDVWATSALQVYAIREVVIESCVLLAHNVFICDYSHGTGRIDIPFMHQPYEGAEPVRIGHGSWIGQNVVILPGVSLGRNCVIGANSVVNESLPDAVMAVGAPARIVKRFSPDAGGWQRTTSP